MGRLSTTRTSLRSPLPCYWEQRSVALQRRTALGQWYDARSAAWIDIQKAHATPAAAQAAFPAGKTCRIVEIAERQSPADPDLTSRPVVRRARLSCTKSGPPLRVGFMLERPRTLGMVAAKSRTGCVALKCEEGDLNPPDPRNSWAFSLRQCPFSPILPFEPLPTGNGLF
jgi:hypothetical protein